MAEQQLRKYSPHLIVADGETVLVGFTSTIEVAAAGSATLNPPAIPAASLGTPFFTVINTGPGDLTITGFGKVTGATGRTFALNAAKSAWVEHRYPGAGERKYNVALAGAVDGSNKDFTVPETFLAGTLDVYLNGVRLRPGAGNDYTVSGTTVTLAAAPSNANGYTDWLSCEYTA